MRLAGELFLGRYWQTGRPADPGETPLSLPWAHSCPSRSQPGHRRHRCSVGVSPTCDTLRSPCLGSGDGRGRGDSSLPWGAGFLTRQGYHQVTTRQRQGLAAFGTPYEDVPFVRGANFILQSPSRHAFKALPRGRDAACMRGRDYRWRLQMSIALLAEGLVVN